MTINNNNFNSTNSPANNNGSLGLPDTQNLNSSNAATPIVLGILNNNVSSPNNVPPPALARTVTQVVDWSDVEESHEANVSMEEMDEMDVLDTTFEVDFDDTEGAPMVDNNAHLNANEEILASLLSEDTGTFTVEWQ